MSRPDPSTTTLADVVDVVRHLQRKLSALAPVTRADVDELAVQLDRATDRLDRAAARWYELGRREKGLFDAPDAPR